MRILAENTLLLGIDFQEKLMPAIFEAELITNNAVKILQGMKELNIPVFLTEQYPKGLGPTVPEILQAAPDAKMLQKMTFSAYDTKAIADAIAASGKKNILLIGTEAHVCVLQTAIDLCGAGYTVAVVADCAGSRTPFNKDLGLKRAKTEGAIITTYEAILFELLRSAESPAFKAISKIVK
jgi:nicotinamidase-related amidase